MAHAFFRSRGLWAGSPAVKKKKKKLLQEIKTKDWLKKKSQPTRVERSDTDGMKAVAERCREKVRFGYSPLKLLPHACVICWTFNNAQALVINDMVLSMTLRLYFISTYCFSLPYLTVLTV